MPTPTRADTWLCVVSVGDVSLGIFDTWTGGEADSEEGKYRPGGMDEEFSLGGRRTLGNIVVARYYDIYRDHPRVKWMMQRVGQIRGSLARIPMTINAVQGGEPLWYSGTLKRCSPPDIDSMGNDAALLELEFTIDSVA